MGAGEPKRNECQSEKKEAGSDMTKFRHEPAEHRKVRASQWIAPLEQEKPKKEAAEERLLMLSSNATGYIRKADGAR